MPMKVMMWDGKSPINLDDAVLITRPIKDFKDIDPKDLNEEAVDAHYALMTDHSPFYQGK
jgi:hypothetical protein